MASFLPISSGDQSKEKSKQLPSQKQLPKDAQVIISILRLHFHHFAKLFC